MRRSFASPAAGLPSSLVMLFALLALSLGCNSSVTSPSGSAPFSQTDLRVGTGAAAAAGNVVSMHYTGWFYDASAPANRGLQFETSAGGDPFTFTLGFGSVIAGWDQGIPGMRVGGLRRLVIPPSMAYGSARTGLIPPNATLVFEVELVAIVQ